jgi:transposase
MPISSHSLREVFNGLRWLVRVGAPWRMMPHDLPPWEIVYQQTQRWIKAGVFEAMVHDLRALMRLLKGRKEQPTAAIFDGRTLQSSPESGKQAGYDGHKHKRGSKTPMAVDTLGYLLALPVTPAHEQDRAQVAEQAQTVQKATGDSVEVAFVDQGYTGDQPAEDAEKHGIRLEVVKLPEAKRDSCFFLGAGSWNAVLPGRAVSDVWRGTTSAFRKPWQGCIFWRLPS